MDVYVLVGTSGTGKSYQAINLCQKKGIEALIDDGLFIHNGEIIAGQSAKREKTVIGAIKAAIFSNEEHRHSVARNIAQRDVKSILVLGTSDGMVERIVKALELGEIKEYIYIDDITTKAEREMARKQRGVYGKHVVPAPALELKKQFSGYFVNPLRRRKGKKAGINEKTEVRPTYSYLGEYTLSEKIFKDIVKCLATEIDGIKSVIKVMENETRGGMEVTILVALDDDSNVLTRLETLQKKAYFILGSMTSYNIASVDVELRELGA